MPGQETKNPPADVGGCFGVAKSVRRAAIEARLRTMTRALVRRHRARIEIVAAAQ